MKVRKWLSIWLVLLLVLSLAGCGAAATDSMMKNEASYDMAVEETLARAPMEGESLSDQSMTTNAITERKWIITINMRAETEDLDALLTGIDGKIEELDGYVESREVYNGSAYSSRRYRNASLTVRIPAEAVDRFTEHVEGVSNVISNNQDMQDITLNYVAVESRVKALQAEEERLLELMEQAENMSDLLEIEARLTQVRYELERVASQLRVYDNQVDYATIYLSISEVMEYTVVEEQTVWQRIGSGFVDSLKGIGNFFVEVFVFLVANLPYLALLGGIVWLIVWLCRRGRKHRLAKRAAAYNPPPYYPPAPDQNKPE